MKLKNVILCVSLMLSPITQAGDIPTGRQLQTISEQKTTIIDTKALNALLDNEPDLVLIDIRATDEIRKMGGAIKATQNVNIPRGWLEYRVQKLALDSDTPIVVYCGVGIRSPFAAQTLQEMGYSNVKNYSAGYVGWKKAGLPITP